MHTRRELRRNSCLGSTRYVAVLLQPPRESSQEHFAFHILCHQTETHTRIHICKHIYMQIKLSLLLTHLTFRCILQSGVLWFESYCGDAMERLDVGYAKQTKAVNTRVCLERYSWHTCWLCSSRDESFIRRTDLLPA